MNILEDIPVGGVVPFAGDVTDLPRGWLICDGSEVDREYFAKLFQCIGTTYGVGDGNTTFNIPDLRARTVIGVNNSGLINGVDGGFTIRNLTETGGEETHQLSIPEMASHTHTGTTSSDGAGNSGSSGSSGGTHTHTFTTANDGGDIPHNNMEPYIALHLIIKT